MRNKINVLLLSLLVTIGLFIYLTVHHYAVQLGLQAPGFCSISETLNCDAAASSSYSEFFRIPIAVLGLCFNLIMLVTVLFKKWGWLDESPSHNGLIKLLFLLSAITSVGLALISFAVIHVGCPFCMATYIFSFINLYLVWSIFNPAAYNMSSIFLDKATWITGAAILIIAWLMAAGIQDNYGLKEVRRLIPEKVAQWRNAATYTFSNLGIIQNPQAAITLVEFADFKCPHCKVASQSLHSFMQGRQNVQFIFKPFPLDGTCNPHIQFKGDGSRCKMAAWALCADKVAKKGWDVHQWYYEHQEELEAVSDLKETNMLISQKFNLSYDEIEKCSESVTTYDEIKKMAEEGKAAQIAGTPTIFVNGKKVEINPTYLSLGLKSIMENLK